MTNRYQLTEVHAGDICVDDVLADGSRVFRTERKGTAKCAHEVDVLIFTEHVAKERTERTLRHHHDDTLTIQRSLRRVNA